MRVGWKTALAVVAALCAFVGWERLKIYRAEQRADEADAQLGIDAARVLTASFAKTSELKVAKLYGRVRARSECESLRWLDGEQRSTAPYVVNYMLDLSKIRQSSYRWDAENRNMIVDIPDITVEEPAVDMSKAKTTQSGIYISRACGIVMQQTASQRLAAVAERKAREPEYLKGAREAARDAVTRYVRETLNAVDRRGINVFVRLPGERRPVGLNDAQWDRSRSIADVVADMM